MAYPTDVVQRMLKRRQLFGNTPQGAGPIVAAGGASTLSQPTGVTPPKPTNYQQLIESDPIYNQIRGDINAGGVSDAASRAAAIRRALIGFGEVPDFGGLQLDKNTIGFLNSDVDQATRDLAGKNTQEGLSLTARLGKAHTDALRQLKNQLAARGMLQSGELGHMLGEENLRFKQGTFDARNSLLDTISGVGNSFLQAEQQRRQQLAQAMADAMARQQQLLGDGVVPTTNPTAAGAGGMGPSTDPEALRIARAKRIAQLMGEEY